MWDLDETIIVFHSLLTGSYAQKYGKVNSSRVPTAAPRGDDRRFPPNYIWDTTGLILFEREAMKRDTKITTDGEFVSGASNSTSA